MRLRALIPAALAAAFACADNEIPAPGSIMVAITTDMQARKDIDRVGLLVTSEGKVIFDEVQQIAPTIYFPTTTALVGRKDLSKPVHVRVYALKGNKARVLRQAITTIPKDRAVLLSLPLEWINDGTAEGTLPDGLLLKDAIDAREGDIPVSGDRPLRAAKCAPFETAVRGRCASATIDSSTLPAFTEEAVFGGSASSGGSCYDLRGCFATPVDVPLDANCEGAGSTSQAFALRLPPGGDGDCFGTGPSAGCYIPLPAGAIEARGPGRIALAAAYCAKRGGDGGGATPASLVASPGCAPNGAGLQVCGDATRPGAKPNQGTLEGDAGSTPQGDGGFSTDGNVGPTVFGPPETIPPDAACGAPQLLALAASTLSYSCTSDQKVRWRSLGALTSFHVFGSGSGTPVTAIAATPSARSVWLTNEGVFSESPSGGSAGNVAAGTYTSLAVSGEEIFFAGNLTIGHCSGAGTLPCSNVQNVPTAYADVVGMAFNGNPNDFFFVRSQGDLFHCVSNVCSLHAGGTGLAFRQAIAITANHVWWYAGVGDAGRIVRAPISTSVASAEGVTSDFPRAPLPALTTDGKYVFFNTATGISAVISDGALTPLPIVDNEGSVISMAADLSGVYWTKAATSELRRAVRTAP